MSKYLATNDVAAALGVTLDRVQDWIASGQLRAVNVATAADGKKPRWRIAETELERFLVARQSKPVVDPAPQRCARKQTASVKRYY